MKLELLKDGLVFPEGPRWREGRLWFSDMHDQRVYALSLDGALEEIVRVPNSPSGLGWLPDGRMLVVSMLDRKLLCLDENGLSEHADLSALARERPNDMVVDLEGRAYVGNFGFDLFGGADPCPTELILVQPDGAASIAACDMHFPNGSVITPDGKTLIVGETFASRLSAFEIGENGVLGERRVFAQAENVTPDGICLDAEGAVWVASPMSKQVVRIHEGGEISARIDTEQMAIACMLGGPDGCTLFVLTCGDAHPDKAPELRSGRIETVQVDVPGAGLP